MDLPVLDNSPVSDVDATSSDAVQGAFASYRVRDYIRNQIERRWSLELNRLAGRDIAVRIRIEIAHNGTITEAVILDKARLATDALFRDIALSARNAVLLSSPIRLPSGENKIPASVTLRLDSKDMQR